MPFLYSINPNGLAISRCPLRGGMLVVGRSETADVAVPEDTFLSHRHFAVVPTDDGVLLRDLGSTNGTWVNDRRVSEHRLSSRDRIRAGHSYFALEQGLATMIAELEKVR
ncbi:MAG: FHA domain-containing protein [Chthoniobacteraceae bacterium]